MKHSDDSHPKKTTFIKKPSYPGGKDAFRKFVEEHLRYPEEALKNKVEGVVFLEYTVDNIGNVENARVLHGIGHGCDEEALRIIGLLTYPAMRNRGMKMKTSVKSRIMFKLPLAETPAEPPAAKQELIINYSAPAAGANKKPEQPPRPVYSYRIKLGN